MSDTKLSVLVGPYRVARRYAASLGWSEDRYAIVCRAHQLRVLDPSRIIEFIAVKAYRLERTVVREISDEIESLSSLWPIPREVAA